MTESTVQSERRTGFSRFSKPSTAQSASAMAIGNVAAMVLRLTGGVILAGLLLPAELGTINAVGLVLTYTGFLQAGVLNGLNRELPYFMGKGLKQHSHELAACALFWSVGCGLAVCMVMLAWTIIEAILGQWQLAEAWGAHTLLVMLIFPSMYLKGTFRTSSEFVKLAITQFAMALVAFSLLALVWKVGFVGQCIRLAAAGCTEMALLWYWRPIRVWPKFRWVHFWHLLKIGLPIFAVGYFYSAWCSLDSVLILKNLGKEQLGYYQLTTLSISAGMTITLALSQVVYPRMSHMYGQTEDARKVFRWAWRPTFLLGAAALPVLCAGWFMIEPVVMWLLPRYAPGIPAAQWSMVTIFTLCFFPPLNIYNVVKRQMIYAVVIGLSAGSFLLAVSLLREHNPNDLSVYSRAMACGSAVFVVLGNLLGYVVARQTNVAAARRAKAKPREDTAP